jgi:hypothetical protein
VAPANSSEQARTVVVANRRIVVFIRLPPDVNELLLARRVARRSLMRSGTPTTVATACMQVVTER